MRPSKLLVEVTTIHFVQQVLHNKQRYTSSDFWITTVLLCTLRLAAVQAFQADLFKPTSMDWPHIPTGSALGWGEAMKPPLNQSPALRLLIVLIELVLRCVYQQL